MGERKHEANGLSVMIAVGTPPPGASLSVGTFAEPFERIKHLLSDRPPHQPSTPGGQ